MQLRIAAFRVQQHGQREACSYNRQPGRLTSSSMSGSDLATVHGGWTCGISQQASTQIPELTRRHDQGKQQSRTCTGARLQLQWFHSPGDEACGKQKSCERAVGMRSGRGEQSRNAVARRERPAAVLQCIWECVGGAVSETKCLGPSLHMSLRPGRNGRRKGGFRDTLGETGDWGLAASPR